MRVCALAQTPLCVSLALSVPTLYSSVSQGVAVPISASGLIGLQPLWRMTHVGKGSRQIRSVPLEKGLALRVVLRVCVGSVLWLDTVSGASPEDPGQRLARFGIVSVETPWQLATASELARREGIRLSN